MKKNAMLVVATILLAATVVRGQDTSATGESEKAYAQGKNALDQGDFSLAISSFSEAIRLHPQFAPAYFGRGCVYDSVGDYDKAVADYSAAVRLDPKYVHAYFNRGLANYHKGNYEEAIADYNEAIRLDPSDPDTYVNRGLAKYIKGKYDEATADYSAAIRLDSKNVDAYISRGLANQCKGEHDAAIADCSEAIRLDPNRALGYVNRGLAYAAKGEYEKEIADCSEAIRVDPKCQLAYYNRGIAYDRTGEYDKSQADLRQAIRLDPKDGDLYIAIGELHERMREYDRAVGDYSKAIRLNPNDAEAYCNRGWASFEKGDRDKAIADFDAAVKLGRATFSCSRECGVRVRILRGEYEAGIADLHAAIALDPNDPAAKFEAWPKGPLTAAAVQHGEEQVRQALRDRPAMARYGAKAEVLYQWAARKFAGEDLHREILWDPSEPDACDAANVSPTEKSLGRIRIRKTYTDGVDKGKEQSFERLWHGAVFELYNITNVQDFIALQHEVAAGRLTKEAFAAKMTECESAPRKRRARVLHSCVPALGERTTCADRPENMVRRRAFRFGHEVRSAAYRQTRRLLAALRNSLRFYPS